MQQAGNLNGQQKNDLDECLGQLAHILKAIGVEEFTMEHDFQYHLVNNEQTVDQHLVRDFCDNVAHMYAQMLVNNSNIN